MSEMKQNEDSKIPIQIQMQNEGHSDSRSTCHSNLDEGNRNRESL